MKNIFSKFIRFFKKKEVYIIDTEELKKILEENYLVCENCKKHIVSIEDVSIVTVKNAKLHIKCYCSKGQE